MAETISDVIEMARKAGLDATADRLDYLYELPVEEGDKPMNPESLELLISFMIEHPEMSTDMITVYPSGHIDVMWNITQHGRLDAKFMSSGNVRFAYVVDEPALGKYRVLKSGESSPDDMLKYMMLIIKHPA